MVPNKVIFVIFNADEFISIKKTGKDLKIEIQRLKFLTQQNDVATKEIKKHNKNIGDNVILFIK